MGRTVQSLKDQTDSQEFSSVSKVKVVKCRSGYFSDHELTLNFP